MQNEPNSSRPFCLFVPWAQGPSLVNEKRIQWDKGPGPHPLGVLGACGPAEPGELCAADAEAAPGGGAGPRGVGSQKALKRKLARLGIEVR